jgi:hypothetical protein
VHMEDGSRTRIHPFQTYQFLLVQYPPTLASVAQGSGASPKGSESVSIRNNHQDVLANFYPSACLKTTVMTNE